MKVVVLDDLTVALEYANKCVADLVRDYDVPLTIDARLSEPIKVVNFKDRLEALEAMEGEALFIVDLGYNVVSALPEVEAELRRDYEIPSEVISSQTEGFACAVAIIRNVKLTKCVIILATSRGYQGQLEMWLSKIARRRDRENDVLIKPVTYALANSQEHACIVVNDAFRTFIDFTTATTAPGLTNGRPLSAFEIFMFKARGMDHTACHDAAQALPLLGTLLGMPAEEVETDICGRVGYEQVYDALTTMGTNVPMRSLAASGAWLLALGAYKQTGDARPWLEVFKVDGEWAKDLRNCFLLPRQQLETLRDSIKHFYAMCTALFEPPPIVPQGRRVSPLQSVSLTVESGLRFVLTFPPRHGERGSLFDNLAVCRKRTLDDQPVHAHNTSAAVWRYWISSSTADGGDFEGLFGESVWRMNLKGAKIDPAGSGTEVSFFK